MGDRSTPEAVFLTAQRAMAAGDWEAFFPCLSAKDLQRLARLGAACVVTDEGTRFRDLCLANGMPAEAIAAVVSASHAVIASADAMRTLPPLPDPTTLQRSLEHRDLVKAQDAALAAAARTVTDPAAFVAGVERLRRELHGGGSVSSRLFLDETLTGVVVDGKKATGVRRHHGPGADEPIGFVQQRGQWHIVLFGRPSAM